MRKLLFFVTSISLCAVEAPVSVMPLYIGVLDDVSSSLYQEIKRDIECSGQFGVTIEHCKKPQQKKDLTALADRGMILAFFISCKDNECEWRLYDTIDASLMKGVHIYRDAVNHKDWAHTIAHSMWKALVGQDGPFMSRLCFIKKEGKKCSLCVADWKGEQKHTIVISPRILVGTSWAPRTEKPYVYFSEFTPTNVRLKVASLHGTQRVVLDLDGTTVGISGVTPHGNVAYCRSGEIWCYRHDPVTKKGHHWIAIKESGICSSPNLLDNGDIIYGCMGKIKYWDHKAQHKRIVVNDGYCVAPSYNNATETVVFSRRVNGIMQVCSYHIKTGKERQITWGPHDKTDPKISPCGTWVVYRVDFGKYGRICQHHLRTNIQKFITDGDENCGYPAWSPLLLCLS